MYIWVGCCGSVVYQVKVSANMPFNIKVCDGVFQCECVLRNELKVYICIYMAHIKSQGNWKYEVCSTLITSSGLSTYRQNQIMYQLPMNGTGKWFKKQVREIWYRSTTTMSPLSSYTQVNLFLGKYTIFHLLSYLIHINKHFNPFLSYCMW